MRRKVEGDENVIKRKGGGREGADVEDNIYFCVS